MAALPPVSHSRAFRLRRFANWFPLGLAYASLYMGRYNLTVAKNELGDLMTKEDFGLIFGAGTFVYAFAFLLNGPLTDRLGGRRAMLFATSGAAAMNLLMGLFIRTMYLSPASLPVALVTGMSVLYAANMYFQSFGAVAIVKVNAHWFHVRERGGFSGIFGTMISSGIFLAFTVNPWFLAATSGWGPGGGKAPWWVFFLPALVLAGFFLLELAILRDRPGLAGHADFDTGDASSGEMGTAIPTLTLMKRIITNPVIVTVALVEFCTGVLRNGVMHWFPIYTREVWALEPSHWLSGGSWSDWRSIAGLFAVSVVLALLAARAAGRKRAALIIAAALAALAPFMQGGWGGILFVAGVIGANIAGWVSDLFFQSRRAPAAGGLYLLLTICALAMVFALGGTTTRIGWATPGRTLLEPGDRIVSVAGLHDPQEWGDIARAVRCLPSHCTGETVRWDAERCLCSSKPVRTDEQTPRSEGTLALVVDRNGERVALTQKDPLATARAGDSRTLAAGPELTLSPFFLGALVFLLSICVIGTHGLLSGTATMDFGGRRGAATAVGMIDGFVYLGTAVQSVSLGYITSWNWTFWPLFMVPFGAAGFWLLTRIWHAKPGRAGGH